MVVRGVQEIKGVFNEKEYHNVILHCTFIRPDVIGEMTERVKIKYSSHELALGKYYNLEAWKTLIGRDITPYYGQYGKDGGVERVVFNDTPAKN